MFLKVGFLKNFAICTGKAPVPETLFNGALSGMRQFLTTGSPLKMMKNAFCFTLKALFVLQIFKFLSWVFGYRHFSNLTRQKK